MKILINILLCSLLLSFLFCFIRDNPVGPNENNFIYPIEIGYKWEYSKELSPINFRPDTLDIHSYLDTTSTATIILEILREETIFDSIQTYVFHEVLTVGNDQFESEKYYNNLDDGLYYYAYRGGGYMTPKSNSRGKILGLNCPESI